MIDCDVHIEIGDREGFLRTSSRASATGSARRARCSARRRTCGRTRARWYRDELDARAAASRPRRVEHVVREALDEQRRGRRVLTGDHGIYVSPDAVGLPGRRLRPRAQRLAARGVARGRPALPRLDRRARAGSARPRPREIRRARRRPALRAGRALRRLASGRTATRATCRSSRPAHELGLPFAVHSGGEGLGLAAPPGGAGMPTFYIEWHTLGSACSIMAHLVSLVCTARFERAAGAARGADGGRPRLAARHPVAARHQLARAARARSPWLRERPSETCASTCASRRSRWSTRTATTTCCVQMLEAVGAPDILLLRVRLPALGLRRARTMLLRGCRRPGAPPSCTTTPPRSTATGWERCPREQGLARRRRPRRRPRRRRRSSSRVGGREIGVLADPVTGDVHAVRNRCPHHGAPLCRGTLRTRLEGAPGGYALSDRRVLACPWHGWEFDLANGRCLDDDAHARGDLPGARGRRPRAGAGLTPSARASGGSARCPPADERVGLARRPAPYARQLAAAGRGAARPTRPRGRAPGWPRGTPPRPRPTPPPSAGAGRARTWRAPSLMALAPSAVPAVSRSAQAAATGDASAAATCHSRPSRGTTVIAGTDGSQAPRSSTAGSSTRVCVASDDLRHEALLRPSRASAPPAAVRRWRSTRGRSKRRRA